MCGGARVRRRPPFPTVGPALSPSPLHGALARGRPAGVGARTRTAWPRIHTPPQRGGRRWLLSLALLAGAGLLWAAPHRHRLRFAALPLWSDPSQPSRAPRLVSRPGAGRAGDCGGAFAVAGDRGRRDRRRRLRRHLRRRPLPHRRRARQRAARAGGRARRPRALRQRAGRLAARLRRRRRGHHAVAVAVDAAGAAPPPSPPASPTAALALVDDTLIVGGAHGRLFIGTPDGVYSLPWPAAVLPARARWQPLVFGAPPADSSVVTALARLGDGVLAGTDDGGAVHISDAGVHALPFAERAPQRRQCRRVSGVGQPRAARHRRRRPRAHRW
jgi:hypothetical protein